jgi:hypothetical protein
MAKHSAGPALSCALAAALTACACGTEQGAGTATPAAVGDPLTESWMYRVVESPDRLVPFEKGPAGGAWLAYFHNDLAAAESGFRALCQPASTSLAASKDAGYPCAGLARTDLELSEFYARAFEIDRVARRQFYLHRSTHPEEVLPSVHEGYFRGVALLHGGDREGGTASLSEYAAGSAADPLLQALARKIVDGLAASDPLIVRIWGRGVDDAPADASFGELPSTPATETYRQRLLFVEAVARGDLEGALTRAVRSESPDLRESLGTREGDGGTLDVELQHGDSALFAAMSRAYALAARKAVGGAPDLAVLAAIADRLLGRPIDAAPPVPDLESGMALVVFSEVATPADLAARVTRGGGHPLLSRLGGAYPGLAIDPRALLADLDSFVRVSNTVKDHMVDRMRAVNPNGGEMEAVMGLTDRLRDQLLVEGADTLVGSFAVRLDAVDGADMATAGVASRSLRELALDKNPSPPSATLKRARISLRNDPPFLLRLAQANLDTRRPYFANDYVRPLTEVFPDLIPVRDALAALDSAWNPMRAGIVR